MDDDRKTISGENCIARVFTGEYKGLWYQGGLLKNLRHGRGTHVTWPNGQRYEGEWLRNEMHGKGVYTWPNGERYDGEWKCGKNHGKGVYVFEQHGLLEEKFEGMWDDDMKTHGVFTYADGTRVLNSYDSNGENVNKIKGKLSRMFEI